MLSRRQFLLGGAAFTAALVLGGAKPPKPPKPPRPTATPRPSPTPTATPSPLATGPAFASYAFSGAFQV